MAVSTAEAVLAELGNAGHDSVGCGGKISVVGAGTVGAACIFALVMRNIQNDLVLIDKDLNLARTEVTDLENASADKTGLKLAFSTDYEKTKNSKVVIITAGQALPVADTIDMEIVKKNVAIYQEVIPQVIARSPHCVLIIVTKPVEVMCYVAWKLSGLSPYKVIGTGCVLFSSRFRRKVAEKLGLSTSSVQAFVIGEAGDNSVPLWSGVTACGIRLRDINPHLGTELDPEDWELLFQEVLKSAKNVTKTKSFNTWGTAASVAKIVETVIRNKKICLPVSTHLRVSQVCLNEEAKAADVFLSLPCIIGSAGVTHIVRQVYSQNEKEKLQKSTTKLHELIVQLNL